MTVNELIEYLQEQLKNGTSGETELYRLRLQVAGKCILASRQSATIMEKGKTILRVPRGQSISSAIIERDKKHDSIKAVMDSKIKVAKQDKANG
jgi:hypothetical protein